VIWVRTYPCPLHLEHGYIGRIEHWVWSYPGLPAAHLPEVEVGTRVALRLGMPKRNCRREPDCATTDIVSQLECAIRRPQATLIGALVGGLVPWFARTLAHEEIPSTWSGGNHGLALVMIAVVLGCACFSGLSVYKFGLATFGDTRKAIGFSLALEGVMLVSHGATSAAALLVLILINALGNGATIALARDATCRRREADARRAATRTRRRTNHPSVSAPRVPATVQPSKSQPAGTPGLVKVPWRSQVDEAIDAEIVSEEVYS
jgi:hypothetical protein